MPAQRAQRVKIGVARRCSLCRWTAPKSKSLRVRFNPGEPGQCFWRALKFMLNNHADGAMSVTMQQLRQLVHDRLRCAQMYKLNIKGKSVEYWAKLFLKPLAGESESDLVARYVTSTMSGRWGNSVDFHILGKELGRDLVLANYDTMSILESTTSRRSGTVLLHRNQHFVVAFLTKDWEVCSGVRTQPLAAGARSRSRNTKVREDKPGISRRPYPFGPCYQEQGGTAARTQAQEGFQDLGAVRSGGAASSGGAVSSGAAGSSHVEQIREEATARKSSALAELTLIYHGSFAPLHAGHVGTFLSAQALLGAVQGQEPRVVLGLTTEDYVERKVGPTRFSCAKTRIAIARAVLRDHGLEEVVLDERPYKAASALGAQHAPANQCVYILGSDLQVRLRPRSVIVRRSSTDIARRTNTWCEERLAGDVEQAFEVGLSSTIMRDLLAQGKIHDSYGSIAKGVLQQFLQNTQSNSNLGASAKKKAVVQLESVEPWQTKNTKPAEVSQMELSLAVKTKLRSRNFAPHSAEVTVQSRPPLPRRRVAAAGTKTVREGEQQSTRAVIDEAPLVKAKAMPRRTRPVVLKANPPQEIAQPVAAEPVTAEVFDYAPRIWEENPRSRSGTAQFAPPEGSLDDFVQNTVSPLFAIMDVEMTELVYHPGDAQIRVRYESRKEQAGPEILYMSREALVDLGYKVLELPFGVAWASHEMTLGGLDPVLLAEDGGRDSYIASVRRLLWATFSYVKDNALLFYLRVACMFLAGLHVRVYTAPVFQVSNSTVAAELRMLVQRFVQENPWCQRLARDDADIEWKIHEIQGGSLRNRPAEAAGSSGKWRKISKEIGMTVAGYEVGDCVLGTAVFNTVWSRNSLTYAWKWLADDAMSKKTREEQKRHRYDLHFVQGGGKWRPCLFTIHENWVVHTSQLPDSPHALFAACMAYYSLEVHLTEILRMRQVARERLQYCATQGWKVLSRTISQWAFVQRTSLHTFLASTTEHPVRKGCLADLEVLVRAMPELPYVVDNDGNNMFSDRPSRTTRIRQAGATFVFEVKANALSGPGVVSKKRTRKQDSASPYEPFTKMRCEVIGGVKALCCRPFVRHSIDSSYVVNVTFDNAAVGKSLHVAESITREDVQNLLTHHLLQRKEWLTFKWSGKPGRYKKAHVDVSCSPKHPLHQRESGKRLDALCASLKLDRVSRPAVLEGVTSAFTVGLRATRHRGVLVATQRRATDARKLILAIEESLGKDTCYSSVSLLRTCTSATHTDSGNCPNMLSYIRAAGKEPASLWSQTNTGTDLHNGIAGVKIELNGQWLAFNPRIPHALVCDSPRLALVVVLYLVQRVPSDEDQIELEKIGITRAITLRPGTCHQVHGGGKARTVRVTKQTLEQLATGAIFEDLKTAGGSVLIAFPTQLVFHLCKADDRLSKTAYQSQTIFQRFAALSAACDRAGLLEKKELLDQWIVSRRQTSIAVGMSTTHSVQSQSSGNKGHTTALASGHLQKEQVEQNPTCPSFLPENVIEMGQNVAKLAAVTRDTYLRVNVLEAWTEQFHPHDSASVDQSLAVHHLAGVVLQQGEVISSLQASIVSLQAVVSQLLSQPSVPLDLEKQVSKLQVSESELKAQVGRLQERTRLLTARQIQKETSPFDEDDAESRTHDKTELDIDFEGAAGLGTVVGPSLRRIRETLALDRMVPLEEQNSQREDQSSQREDQNSQREEQRPKKDGQIGSQLTSDDYQDVISVVESEDDMREQSQPTNVPNNQEGPLPGDGVDLGGQHGVQLDLSQALLDGVQDGDREF
eukprot:6492016-Amphidinium_carterae.1